MKTWNTQKWAYFSIFSLVIVALLGVLMRYKMAFDFPILPQKNIQQAHSHFAFSGWVTQILFVLIIDSIKDKLTSEKIVSFNLILSLHLLCSYGMLFSFIAQGYGIVSITFSTASIFIGFWFAITYWKQINLAVIVHPSIKWFKAGLFFMVLSSLGTFALAYMMATKNIYQDFYLASVYFYLHFQYNGWFWFALLGIFIAQFQLSDLLHSQLSKIFNLFFWSCIPAFVLSVLWLKLPNWIFILSIIGAFAQGIGWIYLSRLFTIYRKKYIFSKGIRLLILSLTLAISLKFLLQLGSTIPKISHLAFGFRTILIAYLHLVLLVIVTGLLLVFLYSRELITHHKMTYLGLIIFMIGAFSNEIVLASQGILSLQYIILPYSNFILFGVSIILFLGILVLFIFTNNAKKV